MCVLHSPAGRNHKSLVDEVIRLEGEQADTCSHLEGVDKHVARMSAQLKHITKTTAALEHSVKKNRENENKENKVNIGADFVPDACKACDQCSKRVSALEEAIQR
jgi:hypothetical protein